MATFVIHTHGRLQEWVAEEKNYFAAEGLTDYTLSSHGLLSSAQTPTRRCCRLSLITVMVLINPTNRGVTHRSAARAGP